MISKAVRASFKATGVYPLNRKAVDIPGTMNDKPIVIPTEKLANGRELNIFLFTQVLMVRKKTYLYHLKLSFQRKN